MRPEARRIQKFVFGAHKLWLGREKHSIHYELNLLCVYAVIHLSQNLVEPL